MRLGVVLPTFSAGVDAALEAAEACEAAGLHGCFCYDHLWPLGEPGRPALAPFPVLGRLALRTRTVALGTLVARIGLVRDEVLEAELRTLGELVGDRLIAGLGTGDHLSAPEHRAYGLTMAPARERRRRVSALATRLVTSGVTTWVGGRSMGTIAAGRRAGAVANLWAAPPAEVAATARSGEVTWGGALPATPEAASRRLAELAAAKATWAVLSWPGSVEPIVAAAAAAGIGLDNPGAPDRFR